MGIDQLQRRNMRKFAVKVRAAETLSVSQHGLVWLCKVLKPGEQSDFRHREKPIR